METKNLMVVGIWAFVIIWLIGMLYLQADLFIAMILFFFATLFSVAAFALPTSSKSQTELLKELEKIRSRIDALGKEVEEIKKTNRY